MTVAEMSPIELYATVMAALIVFSLSVSGGWREANGRKMDTRLRHKAIFDFGIVRCIWGLPFLCLYQRGPTPEPNRRFSAEIAPPTAPAERTSRTMAAAISVSVAPRFSIAATRLFASLMAS